MHHRNRQPCLRIVPWSAVIGFLLLLVACVQVEAPGIDRGTITGTLSYGPTSTVADNASLDPVTASDARIEVASVRTDFQLQAPGRGADFVPGEIIVKFRETATGVDVAPQSTLRAAGVSLSRMRTLALPNAALYRAAAADRSGTLAAIDALNARPDVEYAHPNYVLEAFLQPNDEYYGLMWHYPFVGLEGAWDTTTGTSSTVVAVLDTGMLFGHPDAPVNLLGGYDFVDGDGDPTDPGPGDPIEGTGYHGTHVTGTVAAAANNDYRGDSGADGIAGVSWSTTVLPVRVLGSQGGTIADVADGIVWSAGGSVPDVPSNSSAADVINLSLGVGLPCIETPGLQDAINQAVNLGSTVVAAAGNGGQDRIGDNAANTSPASCTSVFTVGAWTLADDRAPYSNWGDVVDLMAPGGVMSEDVNTDGQPDGVLSLGYNDGTSSYTYVWSTGTSMATPHVSGVVALMLAAEPALTPTQIRDILMNTATGYTIDQCEAGQAITSPSTACGAGILNAQAAVEAAATTSPPPANGELTFSPNPVALGTDASSATVTLGNTGSTSLSWQLVGAQNDPDNPEPIGNDVLYGTQNGTISGGGTQDITVGILRENVTTTGAYTAYYLFDTDGNTSTAEAQLPVTFIIPDDTAGATGPMIVEALLTSTWDRSGGTSSAGAILDYSFSVSPGSNYVYAWSDEDDDGFVSSGDWYGDHDGYVQVEPGQRITNVDFALTYVTSRIDVTTGLPEGVTLEQIEQAR